MVFLSSFLLFRTQSCGVWVLPGCCLSCWPHMLEGRSAVCPRMWLQCWGGSSTLCQRFGPAAASRPAEDQDIRAQLSLTPDVRVGGRSLPRAGPCLRQAGTPGWTSGSLWSQDGRRTAGHCSGRCGPVQTINHGSLRTAAAGPAERSPLSFRGPLAESKPSPGSSFLPESHSCWNAFEQGSECKTSLQSPHSPELSFIKFSCHDVLRNMSSD